MVQLQLLWELQELDLSIKDLQAKIEAAPELSGVDEAKEQLESLESDHAEQESILKADRKKLRQMELEEQSITEQRKELSDSMYGGKVTSVKELEQMQRKVDILAENKNKLEENILNLMELIETQETHLKELEQTISRVRQDLSEKETRLQKELEAYRGELEQLQAKRDQLAEKIDKKYLDKYTMLAQKHHGKALARVAGDICGGCRVFISSGLRGHLYNPEAMVYCENCGRLLVKLD